MVITDNSGQPVDSEMVDVLVILNVSTPPQVRDSLDGLRSAGLRVVKVDEQNGMVEGVAEPKVLAVLRGLPVVKFARLRFEYIAESPARQPG